MVFILDHNDSVAADTNRLARQADNSFNVLLVMAILINERTIEYNDLTSFGDIGLALNYRDSAFDLIDDKPVIVLERWYHARTVYIVRLKNELIYKCGCNNNAADECYDRQ